ncbi:hypothetical protein C1N91_07980 [Curtobacterium sp. SGAir0471]|uniref:hypothetical protein n=1 Tax=Curtobacterium sp. SGAir0471 TaxID=2070337 RepID=UPI0010CCBF4A|nr:hypothetical protein [Curtobacterium sp. SGAir0471]QCR43495.1 hypothetical protein C1N91_07980 [Curtobacterium sp. SGAir0471]
MIQSITARNGELIGRAACVAALALPILTGCAGTSTPRDAPDTDPRSAKQSIVDLVERSTAAVRGEWTVSRGPAVEPCGQDAEDSVRYVHIVERAGATTGLQHDVEVVRAVWEDAGMDVVDTSSGGGSKPVGLRGTGDPVTSIGFDAKPDRSRISGVSVCAAGNATELRDGEIGDAG